MTSVYALTSYPAGSSYNGIFVRNQLQEIPRVSDFEVIALAQVPNVPRPLRHLRRYQDYVGFPREQMDDLVRVLQVPHFAPLPGTFAWRYINGFTLYLCCRHVVRDLLRTGEHRRAVLHSHWLTPRGVAGHLLAREFGLPHVITLRHGALVDEVAHTPGLRLLAAWVLRGAAHVIGVSRPLCDLAARYAGEDKVSLIPNGVSLPALQSLSPAERDTVASLRQKAAAGSFRVLFIGANLPQKGFYDLFAAWRSLLCAGHNVHLTAVGLSALDRAALTTQLQELNVDEHCTLVGPLPWSELRLYYHASDAYVLPTLNEGFPNTLIEAAACGVPLVATRVGGIPDFLRDRENGLFVDVASPESIVRALTHLIEEPEKAHRYSVQALEDVHNGYDMTKNAGKIVTIYQRLLGG